MKNKTTIPIFFSIDDNYAPFLKISLASIISNANKEYNYKIYVLNIGMSEEHKKNILEIISDNFECEFIDMSKVISNDSNEFVLRDYYSNTIYFRLFIPNMFPSYDKAIYIDADTIVPGDISELYNYNIDGYLLGAIADESVQIVNEFIVYVEKYLGLNHKTYFNSGVLLMNLSELRAFNFENKFQSLLRQIKFPVAPDQDYLNVLCTGKVKYLPVIWNKMPFPSDSVKVQDLKIIHYNLSLKPWHYDNILYQEVFYKYVKKLGLTEFIENLINSYTDEERERDRLCGENLKKLTLELSNSDDSYANLLKNGKISF